MRSEKPPIIQINTTLVLVYLLVAGVHLLALKFPWKSSTALSPQFTFNLQQNKSMSAKLLNMRRFGSEKGKGKQAYVPLQKGDSLKFSDIVDTSLSSIQRTPVQSFKDLAPASNQKSPSLVDSKTNKNAIKLFGPKISEFMKQNHLAGSDSPQYKPLKSSGVQVQLEVPEGVKLDKFNETEMIFYGFQRRMAIQYINTLLGHIDDHNQKNPHQQFPLTSKKETLSGKITFDKEGNIVKVQLVKQSHQEKLDHFFQDVLTNLGPLPNPPDAVVNKTGTFSVYYTLTIEI